ncbi:hypothetical protein HZB88_04495 [archaeon]|nr:hypothetical protein [archaeon]
MAYSGKLFKLYLPSYFLYPLEMISNQACFIADTIFFFIPASAAQASFFPVRVFVLHPYDNAHFSVFILAMAKNAGLASFPFFSSATA